MTYAEYVTEYESMLTIFLSYTPTEVGSGVYAEELSDLDEAHPDHAARYALEKEGVDMTLAELSARLGPAKWHLNERDPMDGLEIPVTVTDHKTAYGRDRWLVAPVGGKGQRWVETSSLSWMVTDSLIRHALKGGAKT
jgi:hypothetical protein